VDTPAQAGQLLRGPGFGEITHFDDPHTVVMSGLLFLTRAASPIMRRVIPCRPRKCRCVIKSRGRL
jgi:hypothetical protein